MDLQRSAVILGLACTLIGVGPVAAQTADPIKIGDIASYTTFAQFTKPYRQGVELAIEQINAAGGINGRKLEVIFRDDAAKPDEALRQAEDLVTNEKVVLIEGTFLSSVCLALSDFAARRQIPLVCGIPSSNAITGERGNRYTFHTSASTDAQARMLAAAAAKLPAKRWASVAPNYELGTSFVADFKRHLGELRSDVEWVGEQWPALGKLDAGQVSDALNAAKPDAIFNVTFGPDLVRFVREGKVRQVFKDRAVVSALTGEPEYLDTLKADPPVGWIVSGYPLDTIAWPEHKAFLADFKKKYGDAPKQAAYVGYVTYQFIAAGLKKADGKLDPAGIIKAFEGLSFETPTGPALMRASDHQATVPYWVGTIAVKDGKSEMVDVTETAGDKLVISEDEARKARPANW